MATIRKNSPKYKRWIKRRNAKNLRKRTKRKKKAPSYFFGSAGKSIKKVSKPSRKNDWEEVIVKAPKNFSLINNPDEVSGFFNEVKSYIVSRKNKKVSVYFNLFEVEEVTIDAIIYLLALIKNLQSYGLTRRHFQGNLPQNQKASEMFKESGFLSFVSSNISSINANADKITIKTGRSNDSNVLKEICEFIINKSGCTRKDTKFLYVLMAEMMYNTYEHAYEDKTLAPKNWYIFVECDDKVAKITFVDTGLGIPRTMRKNFGEKLFAVSPDKLVLSALKGEFRSQTKLPYRNNGLPTIKSYVDKEMITKLYLITNKAYCFGTYKNGQVDIDANVLQNAIMGTMFYWEVPFSKLRGDVNGL